MVTPRAGVWIETRAIRRTCNKFIITPRAEVWIETVPDERNLRQEPGHSPCGSVGWIQMR